MKTIFGGAAATEEVIRACCHPITGEVALSKEPPGKYLLEAWIWPTAFTFEGPPLECPIGVVLEG